MEFLDIIIIGGAFIAIIARGVAMNKRKQKRQEQQNQRPRPDNPAMPVNRGASKMDELRERLEQLDQSQSQTLGQKRQATLKKQQMEQQKQQALLQKQQMEQQKRKALLQQAQQQKLQLQQMQRSKGEMLSNADAKAQGAATRGNLGLNTQEELVRGIVLSEILGKPRALRKGRL